MQLIQIVFAASPYDRKASTQCIACLEIHSTAMACKIRYEKPRGTYLGNNFIVYSIYMFVTIHAERIVPGVAYCRFNGRFINGFHIIIEPHGHKSLNS